MNNRANLVVQIDTKTIEIAVLEATLKQIEKEIEELSKETHESMIEVRASMVQRRSETRIQLAATRAKVEALQANHDKLSALAAEDGEPALAGLQSDQMSLQRRIQEIDRDLNRLNDRNRNETQKLRIQVLDGTPRKTKSSSPTEPAE